MTPLLDRRLADTDFCVIDLETTGFSPQRDAIIEIACVRFSGGQLVDGFSTLVHPGQPVTATDVHGLSDQDVEGAPRLEEVAGHVARCLDGAVLSSWNVYFDYPFLRAGLLQPLGLAEDVPRLCCMWMRGLLGRTPARMRLEQALQELDLPGGRAHSAYDDAVATGLVLSAYLDEAQAQGLSTFRQLAGTREYKFLASWAEPVVDFPGELLEAPVFSRGSRFPVRAPSGEGAPAIPLDRALQRMTVTDAGAAAYLDCLVEALADRRLSTEELVQLTDLAAHYALNASALGELHQQFVEAVEAEAADDGVVTEGEASDQRWLRDLLGVEAPPPRARGWGLVIAAAVAAVLVSLALWAWW